MKIIKQPSSLVFCPLIIFLLFMLSFCPYSYSQETHESSEVKKEGGNITIEITYPAHEQLTTHAKDMFFEGTISSPQGIKKVIFDGKDIFNIDTLREALEKNLKRFQTKEDGKGLNTQKIMEMAQGSLRKYTSYHLNQICPLKMGENRVRIEAEDNSGQTVIKEISLRKTPLDIAYKRKDYMLLALLPPEKKGKDAQQSDYIYNKLIEFFTLQARFTIMEREKLPWLLIERGIERGEISEEDIAQQIGKITSAEGVIFIERQEASEGITIFLRCADAETGAILLTHKVSSPIKDSRDTTAFEELNTILRGLAIKFRDSFPLCKGEILSVDGGEIQVNIGSEKGIFPGMRYTIYSKDGKESLGKAVVKSVSKDVSIARIPEKMKSWRIKTGLMVISR